MLKRWWRDFYFVLQDQVLYFYKDSRSFTPSGFIILKYCSLLLDEELIKNGQYGFIISSPLCSITCQSKHEVALAEWVNSLQNILISIDNHHPLQPQFITKEYDDDDDDDQQADQNVSFELSPVKPGNNSTTSSLDLYQTPLATNSQKKKKKKKKIKSSPLSFKKKKRYSTGNTHVCINSPQAPESIEKSSSSSSTKKLLSQDILSKIYDLWYKNLTLDQVIIQNNVEILDEFKAYIKLIEQQSAAAPAIDYTQFTCYLDCIQYKTNINQQQQIQYIQFFLEKYAELSLPKQQHILITTIQNKYENYDIDINILNELYNYLHHKISILFNIFIKESSKEKKAEKRKRREKKKKKYK